MLFSLFPLPTIFLDIDKGLGKPAPVKKHLTEAKDWFKFNHGIVSLEAGTLKANLTRSISSLNPNQAITDRLITAIIAKMSSTIYYMSQCRRWIHWAIELFISKPFDVNDNNDTHEADLVRLMSSESKKIVFWIGRCLSMSVTEINQVPNQYLLSKRIVLEAYRALGRTAAILGPIPTTTTHVYGDLVVFIITEYTRFFKTGDARLREQVISTSMRPVEAFVSLQRLTNPYVTDGRRSGIHETPCHTQIPCSQ